MEATIELPKAFSVRDDHEFFAFKDLMVRLNPKLRVCQVAIGLHVNGDYTVYWGLVHLEGQRINKAEVDAALRQAGFDFQQRSAQVDYACVAG